jgi:hypothetical protein
VGNKAYFAGGFTQADNYSNAFDIYDASTGQWTTDTIPIPTVYPCAVAAGNLILFPRTADLIDIYNTTTGKWSSRSTEAEAILNAGVSLGNLVLLCGQEGTSTGGPGIAEFYRVQ